MLCKINHFQLPDTLKFFRGEIALFKFEKALEIKQSRDNLQQVKEFAISYVVKKISPAIKKVDTSYNYLNLNAHPEILISLSHTKNLLIVVAAKNTDYKSIGVDIEYADRIITPKTSKYFLNNEDSSLDLLNIWTRKEAAYKACSPLDGECKLLKHIVIDGDHFHTLSKSSLQGHLINQKMAIEKKDVIISLALLG